MADSMAGMLEGCEPYSFDFGDREIREWLERNLTAEELADHDRWLEAFPQRRYAFTFWRRLMLWPYWALTWPFQRRRQRHLRHYSALATERGGPKPGPSWKIRREWGVRADHVAGESGPTFTVDRWGPWLKLIAEPGDEPRCEECGCSEPSVVLHHASDCSHGVSAAERRRLFGPL